MIFQICFFLNWAVVIASLLLTDTRISVVFHASEWFLIFGIGACSFVLSNTSSVTASAIKDLRKVFKRSTYTKEDYISILHFLFKIFKFAGNASPAELEKHVDDFSSSKFFSSCRAFARSKIALEFTVDYIRMLTLGLSDVNDMDASMESSILQAEEDLTKGAKAYQKLGDGLPGIGIVAAVLGVISAMGSVGSDVTVVGAQIASALVGTFAGVFSAYAFVMPIGSFLSRVAQEEVSCLRCIKSAISSYMLGHPPSIIVEMARRSVPSSVRPSFEEIESKLTQNA